MSTYRCLGKRLKNGDIMELWRYPSTAAPVDKVERYVLGAWRTSEEQVAGLLGQKQRGILIDLPPEWFDPEVYIEKLCVSYPSRVQQQGSPEAFTDPAAWLAAMYPARSPEPEVVALVRYVVGSDTWWLVEQGLIKCEPRIPWPQQPVDLAALSFFDPPRASAFSTDAAANKAFAQQVAGVSSLAYTVIFNNRMDTRKLPEPEKIAAALADVFKEKHLAEIKEREAKRAKEAAQRLEQERLEQEQRAAEEERQRRIANGDVSVLGQAALAQRLRQKRLAAKGSSS